jgi:phage FluMu gp28-like protein
MAIEGSEIQRATDRVFAQLLPYQRQVIRCNSRFTWNCWSRQTGKSLALSLRRVLRGVCRRRTQLFLSAGMRQTRELMLKVRQHCQLLQIDVGDVESDRRERLQAAALQIRMPNGVRLIGLPARPETVRGFTGDVLLDEFAMHKDDREIWAAIFPTILRGNGELDVASTPKGRDNLFYSLQQNESFARSTVTLPQAIEQGLDIDIEALRRAMGDDELFRQEFLCEFLDESQAFLPHRVIAACEDPAVDRHPDWQSLQQEQGDLYAGIDVARRRDFTVIWLWRRLEQQVTGNRGQHAAGNDDCNRSGVMTMREQAPQAWVLRCAGLIEMGNAPFVEQQEAIRRVLGLRSVRRCCIDATGMGLPLAEWAQDEWGPSRVEAVHFTSGSKAQMAGQLRRLAEEGRLRIPADETIRNDWHSVQRVVGASGTMRLDAARTEGGHADRFWAAALGVYAADTGASGPVEGFTSGGLRFARDGTW